MYKKFILNTLLILFAIFFISCASTPPNTEEQAEFRLTILHTNDLHGRLDNLPQYSTIVKQVREEGGNVLLLDGGDLYRRGQFQRFNGAAETEIFNAMKYDAVVFGNADFPLSDMELYSLSEHSILKNAEFPVLLGNVLINGDYIEGFQPYIIKNMQGVNIAIIGITSLKPQRRGYDIAKRVLFENPKRSLDRLVLETSEISDIQIALSHAGFFTDITFRGVHAVIGADTHLKLTPPFVIRSGGKMIPVVQAGGEEDNYLGRLDLVFRMEKGQWVLKSFNGSLYSLENAERDPVILEIIDKYRNRLSFKNSYLLKIQEAA